MLEFSLIGVGFIIAKRNRTLSRSKEGFAIILTTLFSILVFMDAKTVGFKLDRQLFMVLLVIFALIKGVTFLFRFDGEEKKAYDASMMFGGIYLFRVILESVANKELVSLFSIYVAFFIGLYGIYLKHYKLATAILLAITLGFLWERYIQIPLPFLVNGSLLSAYRIIGMFMVGIMVSDVAWKDLVKHQVWIVLILKTVIIPVFTYVVTSSIFQTRDYVQLLTVYSALAPSVMLLNIKNDKIIALIFLLASIMMMISRFFLWEIF